MTTLAQTITNLINQYVRNYAIDAFQDMRLNRILNLLTQLADANSSGSTGSSGIIPLQSANFVNATDCPLSNLVGKSFVIFFNENQRYIIEEDGEWSYLPGGGFKIQIPNFDASQSNYHFYVQVL